MRLRSFAAALLLPLFIGLGSGAACGGASPPPAAKATPPASAHRAPQGVEFPVGWKYPPRAGAVSSAHGMVVSDAGLASDVGRDVLASGGNAVDAAVALAFALAVVYPAAGNVGGGGFMVARVAGKPYALDFREAAPGKATRDMYIDPQGKTTAASREGHLAAGVPGSVAGLHEAWTKLGSKKKPWAELVAPAIRLADEGFAVDENYAKTLGEAAPRLKKNAASAAVFLPGGAPPAVGSRFKNPELAAVLRRVAERGPAGFYTGETAELVAADMKKNGGLIDKDDLAAYSARWRTPIEVDYRGYRIISMPPPSSGGVVLGMLCRTLAGWDLASMPWRSPGEVHLVVEAMRRAFAARNARLGDPDFVPDPTKELLSDANIARFRASIDPKKATPSSEVKVAGAASAEGPHTTHFSVVDANGDAVGLTTTINWWFGSGATVEGAGFFLNNEMDDFAAQAGTANAFGLVQGEPNVIAPRKRMLSSMTPTVVTDKAGEVVLVLGAAGGPTIITSVYEILSNVIDHGLDVATAVNAPRFHHQHLPDRIVIERGGFPDPLRAALGSMGHDFQERDHIADAPSVGREGALWIGAPEPRRPSARAAGW